MKEYSGFSANVKYFHPSSKGFKDRLCNDLVGEMLNKLSTMFVYEGLPDTMPRRNIEMQLLRGGAVGVAQYDGRLYSFDGGFGGEPDPYYLPTIFTVSNPALNLYNNFKIGEDIAIVKNNSSYTGVLDICIRYASLLVENYISMRNCSINSRFMSAFNAKTQADFEASQNYMRDLEEGKLSVVKSTPFIEGVEILSPSSKGDRTVTDLIEYNQYLRASWDNIFGINGNFNMKRESIGASESEMNTSSLVPLSVDMLNSRKEGFEEVNKMFNKNISVKFSELWERNIEMLEGVAVE